MAKQSYPQTAALLASTLRQKADGPEEAVRAVAALLRERHPELLEPPWTPVAEGLPEEEGDYEVTVMIRGRGGGRKFRVADWRMGDRTAPYGFWSRLPVDATSGDVLAWRPAPKPWTGGGE